MCHGVDQRLCCITHGVRCAIKENVSRSIESFNIIIIVQSAGTLFIKFIEKDILDLL